jgi:hypothetical protein
MAVINVEEIAAERARRAATAPRETASPELRARGGVSGQNCRRDSMDVVVIGAGAPRSTRAPGTPGRRGDDAELPVESTLLGVM